MCKHKMLGFVEIIYAKACDDYYTTNKTYRLCKSSSHTCPNEICMKTKDL